MELLAPEVSARNFWQEEVQEVARLQEAARMCAKVQRHRTLSKPLELDELTTVSSADGDGQVSSAGTSTSVPEFEILGRDMSPSAVKMIADWEREELRSEVPNERDEIRGDGLLASSCWDLTEPSKPGDASRVLLGRLMQGNSASVGKFT